MARRDDDRNKEGGSEMTAEDSGIKIGDVYRTKTGEGLKIETFDWPNGEFTAQVRGIPGEWTEYRIKGDAFKLPAFLREQKAVKE